MFVSTSRLARWLAAIALVAVLATGLCTFQHYGFTVDEGIQREHSLINYQYVMSKLFGCDLHLSEQELATYEHRYYGVALQLPLVALEHMLNFTLQNYHVFLMRHLYTFLICVVGYVCFYFFLRNVFENDWLALLGALMLALYPRFWGEQFNNIKDMPFMATLCASLLCVSLCLKHEGKWRYEVLSAFVFALSTNVRMLGLMLPLLLLGYRVLRDLFVTQVAKRQGVGALWRGFARYLAQIVITFLFYVLITPASWASPFSFAWEMITTFSNYTSFPLSVLFQGACYLPNELPWYYIPVWWGISLPIWYLLLIIISLPVSVVRWIRGSHDGSRLRSLLMDERYNLLCWCVALMPIVAMLFKEMSLYNGWRHFYYTLPFLVTIMLFTVRSLWRALGSRAALKSLVSAALCLLLLGQGVWIAKAHPMEKVYFNAIGKPYANQYDRDYWMESMTHQIHFLLEHDDSPRIVLGDVSHALTTYVYFLNYQEQARLRILTINKSKSIPYIIYVYSTIGTPELDGYTLVHEMSVDGVPISGLFVSNDHLESHFGGVFPE